MEVQLYDTSTGRCLAATTTVGLEELQFTMDRHEVWGKGDYTLPKG